MYCMFPEKTLRQLKIIKGTDTIKQGHNDRIMKGER